MDFLQKLIQNLRLIVRMDLQAMVIFRNNGFKILRKDTDEDIVKI